MKGKMEVGSHVWVYFECGTFPVTGVIRSINDDYVIVDHPGIELLDADDGGWCCQVGRDLDELELIEDGDPAWPTPRRDCFGYEVDEHYFEKSF